MLYVFGSVQAVIVFVRDILRIVFRNAQSKNIGLLVDKITAQVDGVGAGNQIFLKAADRIFSLVYKIVVLVKDKRKLEDCDYHGNQQKRGYAANVNAAEKPNKKQRGQGKQLKRQTDKHMLESVAQNPDIKSKKQTARKHDYQALRHVGADIGNKNFSQNQHGGAEQNIADVLQKTVFFDLFFNAFFKNAFSFFQFQIVGRINFKLRCFFRKQLVQRLFFYFSKLAVFEAFGGQKAASAVANQVYGVFAVQIQKLSHIGNTVKFADSNAAGKRAAV